MKVSLLLIAAIPGLMSGPVMAQELPPIQMRNTEVRYLQSDIMEYEYGVYVTLPRSYEDNPDRIYPTLYIIDGHQYYVYTGEPYGSLIWGNMVKEHIAVSVAYTPEGGNKRSRDFQTRERAADFIRFFQEELIPFVESHYRTTEEDRTLFGHSLGGQFTLFTLLTATDTFDNYIASAPAVNDDIFAFEAEYASAHDDMPVNFFLASGENDHLTINARKFVSQFEQRTYDGLKFDYLFTRNGNHGTIQPTAYIEGLRFVLDAAVNLAPAAYQRLAGTYSDGEHTYRLSYEGGNYLELDGVPESYGAPMTEWRKIYARSESEFFPKGWPGEFKFQGEPGEPAQTMTFEWEGQDVTARRISPVAFAVPNALLLEYVEDKSTFTLLDARSEDEFKKSHLDGAVNMPRDRIDELISALPADKDKLIVTYCRTGSRANLLRLELRDLGYTDIRILEPEQISWSEDAAVFKATTEPAEAP